MHALGLLTSLVLLGLSVSPVVTPRTPIRSLDACYRVLGLECGASPGKVKRAYHQMAFKWHPDKNRAVGAKDRFQQVQKCYEILSDPTKYMSVCETLSPESPETTSTTTAIPESIIWGSWVAWAAAIRGDAAQSREREQKVEMKHELAARQWEREKERNRVQRQEKEKEDQIRQAEWAKWNAWSAKIVEKVEQEREAKAKAEKEKELKNWQKTQAHKELTEVTSNQTTHDAAGESEQGVESDKEEEQRDRSTEQDAERDKEDLQKEEEMSPSRAAFAAIFAAGVAQAEAAKEQAKERKWKRSSEWDLKQRESERERERRHKQNAQQDKELDARVKEWAKWASWLDVATKEAKEAQRWKEDPIEVGHATPQFRTKEQRSPVTPAATVGAVPLYWTAAREPASKEWEKEWQYLEMKRLSELAESVAHSRQWKMEKLREWEKEQDKELESVSKKKKERERKSPTYPWWLREPEPDAPFPPWRIPREDGRGQNKGVHRKEKTPLRR